MFSIQFFVCFYSILYVCQSDFTDSINITKKYEIKMETNLDTINTTAEAIIHKNNTTLENLAENVSKISLGIDNRCETVEKNKSIDNIDDTEIRLILNDSNSTDNQQIVTEKIVKPAEADYLENKTASRMNSKLIESAKELTSNITKIYSVEEQNTIVKNDTTAKILQNNDNLTMIYKNNVDMTTIFQNYDNMTKISQNNDNMTIIFQNNDNKTKISQNNDNITENFQKNNGILKTVEENGFLKNVESNNMPKKTENDDLPKNLKKRDISMPRQVLNVYNPQDFQNRDAKKYQNYDIYKKIKNYDMSKNVQQNDPRNMAQKHKMAKKVHNINNFKPYYQNYEIKYKNIIDKTDMRKKDGHRRIYDDSHNIIPQIQTRLNNELVKKSFDEFKMVRRKTHYTLPDIPIQNYIPKREIERYQDLNYNSKFHEYHNEGNMNRHRNNVELNYYTKDIPNNILYPDQEINHIIYPAYDEVDSIPYYNFEELNKILGRQQEIIEKLTKLQMIERQKPSDFDTLMQEVEKRQKSQNYTRFQFDTTTRITKTKPTTTAKPTTILTLFDETEVRLALKRDPNVRRLLKIGNLKRQRYLKKVKKYLERRNYTSRDKAYTMTSPGGRRARYVKQ